VPVAVERQRHFPLEEVLEVGVYAEGAIELRHLPQLLHVVVELGEVVAPPANWPLACSLCPAEALPVPLSELPPPPGDAKGAREYSTGQNSQEQIAHGLRSDFSTTSTKILIGSFRPRIKIGRSYSPKIRKILNF
jgi:hypothetical protein